MIKRVGRAACLLAMWASAAAAQGPSAPDTVWVVGRYAYYADAATFVDCASGSRYPVAQERDSVALELAYLEARPEPMVALVVALEGYLASRPAMEGDRQETAVVVERFAGIRGDGECPANVALERTTWDVVALRGDAIDIRDGPADSQPHLRLEPADERSGGALGCNRFFGRYTLADQTLSFGTIGSTNMFCAGSMDVESEFLRALEATTGYGISGDTLELTADGRAVATLRARTLR